MVREQARQSVWRPTPVKSFNVISFFMVLFCRGFVLYFGSLSTLLFLQAELQFAAFPADFNHNRIVFDGHAANSNAARRRVDFALFTHSEGMIIDDGQAKARAPEKPFKSSNASAVAAVLADLADLPSAVVYSRVEFGKNGSRPSLALVGTI